MNRTKRRRKSLFVALAASIVGILALYSSFASATNEGSWYINGTEFTGDGYLNHNEYIEPLASHSSMELTVPKINVVLRCDVGGWGFSHIWGSNSDLETYMDVSLAISKCKPYSLSNGEWLSECTMTNTIKYQYSGFPTRLWFHLNGEGKNAYEEVIFASGKGCPLTLKQKLTTTSLWTSFGEDNLALRVSGEGKEDVETMLGSNIASLHITTYWKLKNQGSEAFLGFH